MLAGVGGQHRWHDPIPWIFVSGWLRRLRAGGPAARWRSCLGERGERGEVVAALPGDGQRGGEADGRASGRCVLAGERDWLLARIAEEPDLTLAGAGWPSSPIAAWR